MFGEAFLVDRHLLVVVFLSQKALQVAVDRPRVLNGLEKQTGSEQPQVRVRMSSRSARRTELE